MSVSRRLTMDCDVNLTDHVSDSWELVFRDESRFWIQRVVQPVVVLVGILGNLVTIVVLTRPRMSSSTNTYLTALAVSDLVYLVFLYALSLENHPDNKTAEYYWYWQTWRFLLWIVDSASKLVGLFILQNNYNNKLTVGLLFLFQFVVCQSILFNISHIGSDQVKVNLLLDKPLTY